MTDKTTIDQHPDAVQHEPTQVDPRSVALAPDDARERQLAPPVHQPTNPMALLEQAIARGVDMAQLEKLLDLKDRWDKSEARKAFDAAMAAFHANPPRITKNKLVSFTGNQGGLTEYRHATLDHVTQELAKVMGPLGLSWRWKTAQSKTEDGKHALVTVTCILAHRDGHFEETTLTSFLDDSGKKNPIQQIGSAVSYLQRYTLLSATGMATEDVDDDGQATGEPEPDYERISDAQALTINDWMDKLGMSKENKDVFFEWVKVKRVEDIRASHYDKIISAFKAREAGE